MATAIETFKNFINVLTDYSQDTSEIGRIALDDAIRKTTIFPSLKDAVKDLERKLIDTETYPDTDTRLQQATGIVIGAANDYTVDTGAISGSNAGGSVVKNAQDIVPEDGDLNSATLPTPGSTSQITYTGNDGKSFTFNVKWPDSFTALIDGRGFLRNHPDADTLELKLFSDSKSRVEFDDLDATDSVKELLKNAAETILKGMNTYWFKEGAKLVYDSFGIGLDGQTIEVGFIGTGPFIQAGAITGGTRLDSKPSEKMYITVNIAAAATIDAEDPNGRIANTSGGITYYLDREIAHEMVHATMLSKGIMKNDMPQFFTEGIAEVVHGAEDCLGRSDDIVTLVNDSDTLIENLNFGEGTGAQYAYPAGYMFMRFLAHQNLNTTSIIGDPSQAQNFDYYGNNEVITNYSDADTVNYQAGFTEVKTPGNLDSSAMHDDLTVEAQDGNKLILRDVRGKFMTFNTSGGNVYAYMAKSSTELDGNNFSNGNNYEILFGTNYENDILRAGNGGSQLWGGISGNDELFGGNGQDNFIYNYNDGNDIIHNAESQDVVSLREISIDDIAFAQINDNGVNLRFTDGGTLIIDGQPSTFIVENKTYGADYQNKTWSQKV